MIAAAAVATILGFAQAVPIATPLKGFQSFIISYEDEQSLFLTLERNRMGRPLPEPSPQVLSVQEEPECLDIVQPNKLPSLKLQMQPDAIGRSGAASLRAIVDALLIGNGHKEEIGLPASPRHLVVSSLSVENPVTEEDESGHQLDSLLAGISTGI